MQQSTQLVLTYHDKITTTSMIVAEIFEKRHDNVLRAIKDLDCSPEFKLLNFEEDLYKASNGVKQPMYFITKDGFMMLAMGFTGEKATRFREFFIDAFNKMEKALFSAKAPVLLPTYQKRMLSNPTKSCPEDRWNVFDVSAEIMFIIEKEVGSISQFDLVDGSIGIHWAKFREGKPWAKLVTTYWHEYDDKRGNQECKCYDYTELQHFKIWLRKTYKPTKLFDYLHNKFKKDPIMFPRVIALKPKLIENKKAS